VLWAALLLALVAFRRVLLPFAIAFVIAYLLEPLVTRLERLRIRGRALPRWLAVILLYRRLLRVLYLFGRAVFRSCVGSGGADPQGPGLLQQPDAGSNQRARPEDRVLSLLPGIPLELSAPDAERPSGSLRAELSTSSTPSQGLEHLSAALRTHVFDAVGFVQKLCGGPCWASSSASSSSHGRRLHAQRLAPVGAFARSLVPRSARRLRRADRLHGREALGVVRGQASSASSTGRDRPGPAAPASPVRLRPTHPGHVMSPSPSSGPSFPECPSCWLG
jgi:hypothetical protein